MSMFKVVMPCGLVSWYTFGETMPPASRLQQFSYKSTQHHSPLRRHFHCYENTEPHTKAIKSLHCWKKTPSPVDIRLIGLAFEPMVTRGIIHGQRWRDIISKVSNLLLLFLSPERLLRLSRSRSRSLGSLSRDLLRRRLDVGEGDLLCTILRYLIMGQSEKEVQWKYVAN
jgi:hypothetical protein